MFSYGIARRYVAKAMVLSGLGLFVACPAAQASTVNMTRYYAQALERSYGCSTETAEQIREATKHGSYFVRYASLYVLVERVGQEALPTLIEALDDESADVRREAAHLAGTLGSKAGLERMRKDMEELAPSCGRRPVYEPNMAAKVRERLERSWRL